MSAEQRKPRRDDELLVELERIDERGRSIGVAEHATGSYQVRLRGALPGERVRARVARRRRDRLDAHVLETLRPSPQRVEARCRHFGTCGGCSLQDLAYPAQLVEKRALVQRAFAAVAPEVEVARLVGCDDPWRYRNKMDFTFGTRRWVLEGEPADAPQGFALGLHPREQFRKVLDVEACEIQFERGDAILASARSIAHARGLGAWDLVEHAGLLRHLVLRTSRATGEILVQLVTSTESPELVRPYVDALCAAHPEITTAVQSIRSALSVVAVGERELVLRGSGTIREQLAGLWFTISAGSFFQTNSAQAEKLVALAVQAAEPRASDTLLDLYCGAGTFALPLARTLGEVVGVELVEAAVEDARNNARANAIDNVRFAAGDALEWLETASLGAFDLILVDPPRSGLHPRVAATLARAQARRIVYVSCNPAAAARDLALLAVEGWRASSIRPVDLFPHTPHVECVLALERRK